MALWRHGVTDAGSSTFYADIQSLPAAHYAIVQLDAPCLSVEPKRYWRLAYDAAITNRAHAVSMVRERFIDSVRLHLRSDVPVGSMLSGGIDSSAIVGVARQILGPAADIHSFSFVTPGDAMDESGFARLMSAHAGTRAHEIEPDAHGLVAEIERLVEVQGEPFGSTSMYAQYKVAQAARAAGITVLLDGQGADELFAGYRSVLGAKLAGLLRSGDLLRAGRMLWRLRELPGVRLPATVFHTLSSLDLPGTRRLAGLGERMAAPSDLISPQWRRAHTGSPGPRISEVFEK